MFPIWGIASTLCDVEIAALLYSCIPDFFRKVALAYGVYGTTLRRLATHVFQQSSLNTVISPAREEGEWKLLLRTLHYYIFVPVSSLNAIIFLFLRGSKWVFYVGQMIIFSCSRASNSLTFAVVLFIVLNNRAHIESIFGFIVLLMTADPHFKQES